MMWPYLVILAAFLADRLSKWWVEAYLAEHGPTQLNRFITLNGTYNQGVAFGLFQGIGPWVGWLTIFVVIGMIIYLRQVPHSEWVLRLGLSLIIGGALGNQIDRIWLGHVFDFVETPLRQGVFNVADVCINTGMVFFLIGGFLQRPSPPPPPVDPPPQ